MDKKILSILLSLLALSFSVSSCSDDDDDDDMIWDFSGTILYLDIQDETGNSLLTSDIEGSIVGEVMTLDYQEKEYTLDWSKLGYQIPESRFCPAIFEGLRYFPVYKNEGGRLVETEERIIRIGELPKNKTYETSMILHYNGHNHVIKVKNSIVWIKRPADSTYDKSIKRVPEITTVVNFDGKIIEPPFMMVIKK